MSNQYFKRRADVHPMIYAYEKPGQEFTGLLKVGYTEKDVEARVAQQFPTKSPDGVIPYRIVFQESAMKNDGSCFTDHDVHRLLKKRNIQCVGGEWFRCTVNDVKAAMIAIKTGTENSSNRTNSFGMRPEQKEAVEKTERYYISAKAEFPNKSPKFLWNAKMRFGKTFSTYELAKKMGFKRILILTFKPAVESSWEEDLNTHIDFEGWQFISNKSAKYNKSSFDKQFEIADKTMPIVCFGSFQDLLGTTESGGIKPKNEWIHTMNWDLVVFDEYHYGAWRDSSKKLFELNDDEDTFDFDYEKYKNNEAGNAFDESYIQITAEHYLYLSGTPFRAINSGEFIEEQIYNWTYSDEQKAKKTWNSNDGENPYEALPRMVMMTYRIPDSISNVAKQGELDEFDLNVFFSAQGTEENAKFVYESEVQKWLDLIRGSYLQTNIDELKVNGSKRPPMPFSDVDLLNVLTHTLWFLPNVASCYAMANLLKKSQNSFYHDYNVIVCAGTKAGVGVEALKPVLQKMGDPLESKTITLSCGKLTTGVTIKPWTGIFMLRNLKSPETYFQAAFRVQSPWTVKTYNGGTQVLKEECYVFDFALDRALKQVSDYSCRLNVEEHNPEKKVSEFIKFLPILAYDGAKMVEIDAQDVLDIATAGTSATLLAKRWESPLLVNVDNDTLKRLKENPEAMAALMNIEAFRTLNTDIEAIINKSEHVKEAKTKNEPKNPEDKKQISDEEKEFRSLRKQIQDKLIKFATRIPIFMYLTDYRENTLKDVITQLEPDLFKKVTGLEVKDFSLLCEINVFNGTLMNDAIFKFKRYEDASLSYTGINKHENENVGGWDMILKREEFDLLYFKQQKSMK